MEAAKKLDNPFFAATHAPAPSAARTFGALAKELDDPELIKLAAKIQDNGNSFSREDATSVIVAIGDQRAADRDRIEELKQLPADREDAREEIQRLQSRVNGLENTRLQLLGAKRYLLAMESAGAAALDRTSDFTTKMVKELEAYELFFKDMDARGVDVSDMKPNEFKGAVGKWIKQGGLRQMMTNVGPLRTSNETLQQLGRGDGTF